MFPVVRGKFLVYSKTHVHYNNTVEIVKLHAIYDTSTEENRRFTKSTPSGTIELTIDNPPASEALELGKAYYIDFTPCPAE